MAPPLGKAHKDLSADALFSRLRSGFDSLLDPRPRAGEVQISLSDALMSAFAMFSSRILPCSPSIIAVASLTIISAPSMASARPLRHANAGHR